MEFDIDGYSTKKRQKLQDNLSWDEIRIETPILSPKRVKIERA